MNMYVDACRYVPGVDLCMYVYVYVYDNLTSFLHYETFSAIFVSSSDCLTSLYVNDMKLSEKRKGNRRLDRKRKKNTGGGRAKISYEAMNLTAGFLGNDVAPAQCMYTQV